MTNAENTLKTRRSVRSYLPEQIKDEELERVLECGLYAASGRNRQCVITVAVQDEETIETMRRLNAAVMGADTDPFYGAPTVVVVFADKEVYTHVEDGSLVMGNLMNAAHAVGLGSCWIHRAREAFETDEGKELMKKWGVPDSYEGIGNCILGYAASELAAPAPRAENRVIIVK